jgi:hypothetical protein
VLEGFTLGEEVFGPLVHVFKAQQGAYAFAERILVADHGARDVGVKIGGKYSPNPGKNKGFISSSLRIA